MTHKTDDEADWQLSSDISSKEHRAHSPYASTAAAACAHLAGAALDHDVRVLAHGTGLLGLHM